MLLKVMSKMWRQVSILRQVTKIRGLAMHVWNGRQLMAG
jgi:hypothetical protein